MDGLDEDEETESQGDGRRPGRGCTWCRLGGQGSRGPTALPDDAVLAGPLKSVH